MSVSYGFFDGKYTTNKFDRLYISGRISEMFNGVITDGVYLNWDAGKLTVTKTDGYDRSLTVSPGKAWFDGTWTINDSNLYLAVDSAETDRTDAVVLEVNKSTSERINSIKIVKNAESVDDLTRDGIGGPVNQYALAYIHVRGGDSEIHEYDIDNVVGSTETPYFAWILQDLDVSDTVNKWSDILGRTTIEFIVWFAVMQSILGYGDEAYMVLYNHLIGIQTNTITEIDDIPVYLQYINRLLPRVNEITWTTIATSGQRTYTISSDYVHIANVRVNGKYYPYSVDGNKITFIDAPASGATITVKLVPDLDLYNLYFEEPES